jgi:hypothetical protein
MKKKTVKDLENLFSWAHFYQNSNQLAVPRYPRRYKQKSSEDSFIKINTIDIPDTDNISFEKVQAEIVELKELLFNK